MAEAEFVPLALDRQLLHQPVRAVDGEVVVQVRHGFLALPAVDWRGCGEHMQPQSQVVYGDASKYVTLPQLLGF